MKKKKIVIFGFGFGQHVYYRILKSIPNPSKEAYEIKMKIPELTFEGVRGQPDFGVLYITFYPCGHVVELKSLKE